VIENGRKPGIVMSERIPKTIPVMAAPLVETGGWGLGEFVAGRLNWADMAKIL
jgi:hypothetical protein